MENLSTNDIQREMDQTRSSLTEKLTALENQVVGTIQSANEAVADTVESVKSVVTDTVDSVKDTVSSVKGTMDDMTASVKDTFDIPSKVRENPWIAVGGSLAAGFVSGLLLGKSSSSSRSRESRFEAKEATPTPSMYQPARSTAPPQEKKASWFDDIFHRLEQQAKRLGEAAINQLGDAVVQQVGQIVPGIVEKMKATNKRHEPHRNGGNKQREDTGFSRRVG